MSQIYRGKELDREERMRLAAQQRARAEQIREEKRRAEESLERTKQRTLKDKRKNRNVNRNKNKRTDRVIMKLLIAIAAVFVTVVGVGIALMTSVLGKIHYQALDSNVYVAQNDNSKKVPVQDAGELGLSNQDQIGQNDNDEKNPVQNASGFGTSNQEKKVQKSIDGKKYRNIAVIGVDARDQEEMTSGTNGDVIMIVSINNETGEVRLASVLRDTLMQIVDGGEAHSGEKYAKANAQICYTGISDMISVLNMNLDLDIQEYVVVNWKGVAEVMNQIGGLEVTIENEEIKNLLNGYLTETNEATGIFAPQITKIGTQMLTGTQIVSYCRIRYAGLGDSGRADHQKEIAQKTLEKCKLLATSQPDVLLKAAKIAASSIVTNLTADDLIQLVLKCGSFSVTQMTNYPSLYTTDEHVGNIYEKTGITYPIVADSVEENVKTLHQFLFDDSEYQPSQVLKTISDEIYEMMTANDTLYDVNEEIGENDDSNGDSLNVKDDYTVDENDIITNIEDDYSDYYSDYNGYNNGVSDIYNNTDYNDYGDYDYNYENDRYNAYDYQ